MAESSESERRDRHVLILALRAARFRVLRAAEKNDLYSEAKIYEKMIADHEERIAEASQNDNDNSRRYLLHLRSEHQRATREAQFFEQAMRQARGDPGRAAKVLKGRMAHHEKNVLAGKYNGDPLPLLLALRAAPR